MAKRRTGLKKKESKNFLWEIIDDILYYKKGTLLDNPEYEKNFSPFMAVRALSMIPELIEYASYMNTLHQTFGGTGLDKKRFYKMLIKVIPRTEEKITYLRSSSSQDKDTNNVMEYFGCNKREAIMYIDQYGDKWVELINKSRGGIINE
jgi:hypothetical protein